MLWCVVLFADLGNISTSSTVSCQLQKLNGPGSTLGNDHDGRTLSTEPQAPSTSKQVDVGLNFLTNQRGTQRAEVHPSGESSGIQLTETCGHAIHPLSPAQRWFWRHRRYGHDQRTTIPSASPSVCHAHGQAANYSHAPMARTANSKDLCGRST